MVRIYEAGKVRSWSVDKGRFWLFGFFIYTSDFGWSVLYLERCGNKKFRITKKIFKERATPCIKDPDIKGFGYIRFGQTATWNL